MPSWTTCWVTWATTAPLPDWSEVKREAPERGLLYLETDMGSRTILVDANSIGYACHHATKLNTNGMQTQAIFGFIKTMRQLRVERPDWRLMVLWDGRAEWRYDLHPLYKSGRESDPKKVKEKEAYSAQRPFIARALNLLGVRQLTAMKHEADDMAGLMVAQLSQKNEGLVKPEHLIELATGDLDWAQLVRPGVTWHDRRSEGRTITIDTLMDETGFATPLAFLEGKALQGDTSDSIPGVGGIGEKGAPEFLAEFGSVRNFWKRCDSGDFLPRLKAHQRLCSAEGRMVFGRNLRLMQLLKVAPPAKSDVRVDLGKLDPDGFADLCAELNFLSMTRNVDHFTSAFKELA